MRISDQYVWNFLFSLFFTSLIVSGVIILDSVAARPMGTIDPMTFFILALAIFRLTRLIVHDKITAFFREQFYDVVETKTKRYLEKPASGPRRTMADLLSCPWCIGMWASATILFFYHLTLHAWFPILFFALAGLGTLFQLLANIFGWKAEQLKRENES